MSDKHTTPKANIPNYSVFWPVFLVFLTLGIVQAYYLRGTLKNRDNLQSSLVQMENMVARSQTINLTVESVGRELMTLSDGKTNEAAKIIAEFDIKIQQAATNSPAP